MRKPNAKKPRRPATVETIHPPARSLCPNLHPAIAEKKAAITSVHNPAARIGYDREGLLDVVDQDAAALAGRARIGERFDDPG